MEFSGHNVKDQNSKLLRFGDDNGELSPLLLAEALASHRLQFQVQTLGGLGFRAEGLGQVWEP